MRPHLATLLDDFRRYGQDCAVVSHTGNRSLPSTYAELAEFSARFAAEYARRGIESADRILLWGQNSAAWIAAFYGCVLRGVLVVPLDAAGDLRFAQRIIAETSPRLLVGDPSLLQKLLPSDVPTLLLDATRLDATGLPAPDYAPIPGLNRSTPLQIIFTSGTTSEPKGIVHTHGNVLASLDQIEREIAKYRRYERLLHPLRFLQTLPLSHVFGQFMGLWVPPLLAAEVHFESRLDAPRLIQLIHAQRISVLAAVPRVLELLHGHLARLDPTLSARLDAAQNVSALSRWWLFRRQRRLFGWKFWAFVCGGATLPDDLEQFWTRLGFALIQGYGMTETTALVTLNHPFHTARGSIGKPLAGREIKIAEDGEILVRGDSIAETEWRAGHAQTRNADGGWLRTGDLAARNDKGELVFTGRKSDVIVTAAGLNVHPQDLEAALTHRPGVRDACAFSFDSGGGPQPAAALLMSDASKADAAVTSANATLADHQQIRRWLLWPDLDFPRTSTGKVKRREVAGRAQLAFTAKGEISAGDDPLLNALRRLPGARVDNVTEASRLSEDIGIDSLGMVELQSMLEQQFAIEIPDDAWQHTRTVGDLRSLITPQARTAEAAVSTSPAQPPVSRRAVSDNSIYPRWPWSTPIRWLRVAFLECVSIPLTYLLLDPRIVRPHIIRPHVIGLRKPFLIVANHVTAYDLPLVLAALPASIRRHTAVAMAGGLLTGWRHARAERHAWLRLLTPLAYWLVTALFNVFPLPQGAGFRRSFAHAGAAMDHGMSVILFPEGGRSADERLATFQSGIGLLARESAAPVLPVAMVGLGEIKQRKRRWFRPGTVTIRVGHPVTMGIGETPQEFTARLEAQFRAMLVQP
ncbi:MAG TPA: AMP-binding protein [Acidobacteriaceae bacterium]|nr:AMP-binding protein [Acidobacteriaceae bacterium]